MGKAPMPSVESAQQFFARLRVADGRLFDRFVEGSIEIPKFRKSDSSADADFPEVQNGSAQQAVLDHDLVKVEASLQPGGCMLLWNFFERCLTASVNGFHNVGNPRNNPGQEIDEGPLRKLASG